MKLTQRGFEEAFFVFGRNTEKRNKRAAFNGRFARMRTRAIRRLRNTVRARHPRQFFPRCRPNNGMMIVMTTHASAHARAISYIMVAGFYLFRFKRI